MLAMMLSYLIFPLEALCYKILFEIFCHENGKRKLVEQIFFLGIFCCLDCFLANFFKEYFIKEIFVINTLALMAKRYWGITYRRCYILTIVYCGLTFVADYVALLIDPSIWFGRNSQNDMMRVLLALLTRIFLLLFLFIIRILFRRREFEYLEGVLGVKFLIFPLFSMGIATALSFNLDLITIEKNGQLLWSIALGLVGMYIFLFYFILDIANKERKLQESRIFELEANNQLEFYESVSASVEKQRKMSHEYQNQLVCIQLLLQNQELGKLKEYMEQITGNILENLDYIDTNNVIVNAILNEKYRQALEKNIVMVCKISDLSCLLMEEQDIALLLSNLLNNAIEACQKCREKRIIKCKMVCENENVIISIQNTHDGNISFTDGEYLTTKEQDAANHGLGIKNVIQVVNKYSGIYSIRHTETDFYFSIIIPQDHSAAQQHQRS